jgi:uncharacterized protein (UPF0332 family)
MPQEKTLEETYDNCISQGYLKEMHKADYAKIEFNLKMTDELVESAKDDSSKKRWSAGYGSLYDALHMLVEAFLIFDKIHSSNHQCLFAYLCHKHPELELDWNFFERVRTRRNGINYYGRPASAEDFREDRLGFELYTKLLRKEIVKKLKEN